MRLGLSLKLPGLTAWGGYPVPYLFQNGEQGFWYDPSDFSTLFQDAAGTTPVTAVEQPCSLMLDKRLGLVLGSNIVTNGDFSQGNTGWNLVSAAASITGGALVFDGSTSITASTVPVVGAAPSGQVTAGKWYEVTYIILSSTTLPISVGFQNNTGTARTDAGTYKEYILAANTGDRVAVWARATTGARTGSIDNISVRELPGNHAYTPAAASTARPTVSARVNEVQKTEQFDDAYWPKTDVTVTANAVSAPNGTMTADKLIESATTAGHRLTSSTFTAQLVQYRISISAKAAERSFLFVRTNLVTTDVNAAWFNLSNGTVGTVAAGFSATIIPENDGYYRCTVTCTANGTNTRYIGFGVSDADNVFSYTGDGTSGIFIWGADLRVANDGVGIPPYQRVNTASDYDVSGFPVYLRADGSNDYMLTNSIDFSATDKMTICAGVRKLSDAAGAVVAELSTNRSLNNGAFTVIAPSPGLTDYTWISRGTIDKAVTANDAAPSTRVLTGLGDISGDSAILRLNGAQAGSNTGDQGTGNYGNYPLYLFSRAGTSLFFNGRFYGSVGRGAQSNDQQIAALEGYMNTKTAAY